MLISDIQTNNIKLTKMLIENGADIHAYDADYAIRLADYYEHLEVTEILKKHGAKLQ